MLVVSISYIKSDVKEHNYTEIESFLSGATTNGFPGLFKEIEEWMFDIIRNIPDRRLVAKKEHDEPIIRALINEAISEGIGNIEYENFIPKLGYYEHEGIYNQEQWFKHDVSDRLKEHHYISDNFEEAFLISRYIEFVGPDFTCDIHDMDDGPEIFKDIINEVVDFWFPKSDFLIKITTL